MQKNIQVVMSYGISDGNANAVKTLAEELTVKCQKEDEGVLSFEFFVNADESELSLIAVFRDSEAVLAHEEIFAKHPIVEEFHVLAPVKRVDAFGIPSTDLTNAFQGLEFRKPLQGFAR